MMASAGTSPTDRTIAVCVCTYRRQAGLRRLLDALVGQVFTVISRPEITVVVADNECSDETRKICAECATISGLPISYVEEPRRGISHARNACLDNLPSAATLIAMIDDDEVPEPTWLQELIAVRARTGADMVFGPTVPEFPPGVPVWIEKSGFFMKPRDPDTIPDLSDRPPMATSNALLDAGVVARTGLRFEVRLGLTGSEDVAFFRQLQIAGCTSAWARSARVIESVPAARATLRYMVREEFRRGNTLLYQKRLVRRYRGKPERQGLAAGLNGVKMAFEYIATGAGHVLVALLPWRPEESVMGVARIARGVGILGEVLGYQYQHYR